MHDNARFAGVSMWCEQIGAFDNCPWHLAVKSYCCSAANGNTSFLLLLLFEKVENQFAQANGWTWAKSTTKFKIRVFETLLVARKKLFWVRLATNTCKVANSSSSYDLKNCFLSLAKNTRGRETNTSYKRIWVRWLNDSKSVLSTHHAISKQWTLYTTNLVDSLSNKTAATVSLVARLFYCQ